jgi:hypothetical protein
MIHSQDRSKYEVMNSEKRDQYWCLKQSIVQDEDEGGSSDLLPVVETSDVIIGTRSEPTCVDERVVDVIEAIDKFHLIDENELHMAVNWDEVTRVVDGSLSAPSPSISGIKTSKNTILVAVSCLILAVVIPISVFLLRSSMGHRNASSPTQISEWFVASIKNDDTDHIAHTLELS